MYKIVRRVSPPFLIISLFYLLFLTIFHWGRNFSWGILFFFMGGILGVYFLDLADYLFKISPLGVNPRGEPSPFRNVVFQSVSIPLALFVLTSSGSLFGAGLILSMFLGMVILQYQEFSKNGNIQSWFWVVKTEINPKTQQIYLGVMVGIFILLSLLFI